MKWHELYGAVEQPSPTLLSAARAWVDNTVMRRSEKIGALLVLRDEANRYLAPSYPTLYRGHWLTADQQRAIRKGETLLLPMNRLASWSGLRKTAEMFAEHPAAAFDHGDAGAVIAVAGSMLRPFLDFSLLVKAFSTAEIEAAYDQGDDTLYDMAREKEVIVEHAEPLPISRANLVKVYRW